MKAKKLVAGILGLGAHPFVQGFGPLQLHCSKNWCRTNLVGNGLLLFNYERNFLLYWDSCRNL